VKPPDFAYHRPSTIDEALDQLGEFGGDGKVLAGHHEHSDKKWTEEVLAAIDEALLDFMQRRKSSFPDSNV